MNEPKPPQNEPPASPLGTLGWVGAVVLFALLAIALLSWLGPVQGR